MTKLEARNIFHKFMYPETFDNHTHPRFVKDVVWAKKAVETYEALGMLKLEKESD